jgi:hypothetical protein
LRLLKKLAPDEVKFYDNGAEEVEDIIKRPDNSEGAAPTPFNSFAREVNMPRKVIFIDSVRKKC